jgi:hypothetical protein
MADLPPYRDTQIEIRQITFKEYPGSPSIEAEGLKIGPDRRPAHAARRAGGERGNDLLWKLG